MRPFTLTLTVFPLPLPPVAVEPSEFVPGFQLVESSCNCSAVSHTMPPPPPIDCAIKPFAPAPWVLITLPAFRLTVPVLPSPDAPFRPPRFTDARLLQAHAPPRPPPPPLACASLPYTPYP